MKRNRPEEQLHRALVAYLRLALPKPWLVFHVPNGGGRSKAEAGILKAMGVLAGMPDLLIVGPWSPPAMAWLDDPIGSIDPADTQFLNVKFNAPARKYVIAIELKAPPKPLARGGVSKAKPSVSDAQRDVIEQLGQCGVPTLIVRSMEDAQHALAGLGVPLKASVR